MTFISRKLVLLVVGLTTILYGASSSALVLAIEPLPLATEARGHEKLFCVEKRRTSGALVFLPLGSFAKVSRLLGPSPENCLHADFPVLAEVSFITAETAFRHESRTSLSPGIDRPVGLSITIPGEWEAQDFTGAMKTDQSTIAYLLNRQLDLRMTISIFARRATVGSLDSFVDARRDDFRKILTVSEAHSSEIMRFQSDGIERQQFYTVASFKPSSKRFKFIRHFLATESHLIHVQFHGSEDKVDSSLDHIDSVVKSVARVKSNLPSAVQLLAAEEKHVSQLDLSPSPGAKLEAPHEICEKRGFKRRTDQFLECLAIFSR